MEIQDIKKSLFMNLAAFASYTGILIIFSKLYIICLIYSYILPVFILINFILFGFEIKKNKLFFPIPNNISNNILFSIIFYIGLLLSFNYLFITLMFIIDVLTY